MGGIPTRLLYEVAGRAATYWQREPFDLTYGLGLLDALRTRQYSAAAWRRRLVTSFGSLDGYRVTGANTRVVGRSIQLEVSLEGGTPQRRATIVLGNDILSTPSISLDGQPEARWNGIWAPVPMQVVVDGASQMLNRYHAYLDYDRCHPSVLPVLAWQEDAIAFDPDAPVPRQRVALKQARRLHTLIGTEAAFHILMEINATVGNFRLVGDYDAAGNKIPRDAANRFQGEFMLDTNDPLMVATDEFGNDNPDFVHNGYLAHKYVALDIVQPADRTDSIVFAEYISRAARRTIAWTLHIAEVNIIRNHTLSLIARLGLTPRIDLGWIVEGERWP